MKKILLLAITAIALLTSCKKDEINKDCSAEYCGTIISRDISSKKLTVENFCSGNNKTFTIGDMIFISDFAPGNQYCAKDKKTW